MLKLSAALFAAFALAQSALAQWQLVSSKSEPGPVHGLEYRHVALRDSAADATTTIDFALASSASVTLRVIDNSSGSENLAETMARGNFAAGVNGGYFDPKFKPIGLRIIDGAVTSPLARARLLTGVLCASARGIAIVRLGEFSRRQKLEAAIECGPFLVDGEKRVGNLDNSRVARRTFAAVMRGGKALLGVSSKLTLAQLAEALADRSITNDFQIWRAMNLDGGSSSAFWFKKNDSSAFSVAEDKRVRDFVGVVPK